MVSLSELPEYVFDFLGRLVDSYRFLNIPLQRYLTLYVGSAVVFSLVSLFSAFVISDIQILDYVFFGVAGFAPLVAFVYPLIQRERARQEINENFHLFITHVTVLSLTNTDRIDIFREIANEDEYGSLATEMGHLVAYIDTFNMSLDDACRRRANETSSDLLGNFYEKMAYSIGSGQSISAFLYSEQEDARKLYATDYEARLQKLETVGELFLSMALTSAFLLVFAMLMPFLTGLDPLLILGGVVFLYAVIQLAFVLLVGSLAPEDPLWYFPDGERSRKQLFLQGSIAVGFLVALLAIPLVFLLRQHIPVYFYVPIVVTPLALPMVAFIKMERQIRSAEDQYASFIRGLGSIESVKQTSTEDVLETLKDKDFGALSEYIHELYRRLFLSVDTRQSWHHFTVDIGSNIIKRFTDMFVLGREMGGDPEKLGHIVSENFRQVHQLRQKRKTMKRKITGLLYGITGATSFTFFAAYEILEIMVSLGEEVQQTEVTQQILYASAYNMPVIQAIIFGVVFFNAIAVGIIIRRLASMHQGGAVTHVFVLTWINFTIGYGVARAAAQFNIV